MARSVEDETTVNESYSITVPASVRAQAGIEPGDRLRWSVDEAGTLTVDVVKQRRRAFASLDPVTLDEETDAANDHDETAGEY